MKASCFMILLGYIDPGTGFLILQALTAVVAGFLFSIKKFRDFLVLKIKSILTKEKPSAEPAPPDNVRRVS